MPTVKINYSAYNITGDIHYVISNIMSQGTPLYVYVSTDMTIF